LGEFDADHHLNEERNDMNRATGLAGRLGIGVGLLAVAAIATLRGVPHPRLWLDRTVRGQRSAQDRAARLAQESTNILDRYRAAGL
jgi:hypothetical protein